MTYSQLKALENSISMAQARLGVLRVDFKMHQGMPEQRATEVQRELDKLIEDIDDLQKKYITAKEVNNG